MNLNDFQFEEAYHSGNYSTNKFGYQRFDNSPYGITFLLDYYYTLSFRLLDFKPMNCIFCNTDTSIHIQQFTSRACHRKVG